MKRNGRIDKYTKTLFDAAGVSHTVEDAIRTLTSELLRDATFPPTDLDSLKAQVDVVSITGENIPLSGELRREKNGLHIVYSTQLPKERRRFTIAHELGHAWLHKLGRRLPHSGSEVELLCDKFAAEILMPRETFRAHLGSALTVDRLFVLRRTFEASLSAIAHRCFELNRDSVFEIDKDKVTWGVGLVKDGPVDRIETGLRLGVDEAKHCEKGVSEVYFVDRGTTYRGELEWSRSSLEKTLFILRRNNKELAVTATGF